LCFVDGICGFAPLLLGPQLFEVLVLNQTKTEQTGQQRYRHVVKQCITQTHSAQRGADNLMAAEVELSNEFQDVYGRL